MRKNVFSKDVQMILVSYFDISKILGTDLSCGQAAKMLKRDKWPWWRTGIDIWRKRNFLMEKYHRSLEIKVNPYKDVTCYYRADAVKVSLVGTL